MDTRRHLILVVALVAIGVPAHASSPGTMAPVPNPGVSGPPAIAAANREARFRSQRDRFEDSLQVFDYAPGRIYEIWTSPMRVTALSLAPGESVLALAAGDTLRWQIAEAASGEGSTKQVHVLIKPMVQGLATNLVLTTSIRIYLISLRSGRAGAFNTAVAWTPAPPPPKSVEAPTPTAPPSEPAPLPDRLDSGFRVYVRGTRPAWTPIAVVSDGHRTMIVLPPGLAQTPALFALSPDGRPEMVNYRQAGDVLVVDRVLERAELRPAGERRGAVRIRREETRR